LNAVSQDVVYTHDKPILSMERASDGTLYFSDFTGIHRVTLT
jgi:hypothetical protein